jgi:hypothetical protein
MALRHLGYSPTTSRNRHNNRHKNRKNVSALYNKIDPVYAENAIGTADDCLADKAKHCNGRNLQPRILRSASEADLTSQSSNS